MDPMSSILNYEADPNEDYYGLLGCDASASTEQIIAEYKARAKDCHPDRKNQNAAAPAPPGPASSPQLQSREKFQHLLRAKEVLTDPQERGLYDSWCSAGIAMRYSAWRNLKSSVRSSMHWATPRTSGRMLDMVEVPTPSEPLSLNPSPVDEKYLVDRVASASTDSTANEDTTYDPTPYEKVGFRITTPPPTFWKDDSSKEKLCHPQSTLDRNSIDHDPATAMKRRQFAVRRQSTIGAMIWAEKYDDNEIRRRFRNYEI